MSKISQNDLVILHKDYICQTCKIIGVNNELAILAFILLVLGRANFECQHMPPLFLGKACEDDDEQCIGHICIGHICFSILLMHSNVTEIIH